jgi:uncharacterized membrane protein HdeD (DUF308 family)
MADTPDAGRSAGLSDGVLFFDHLPARNWGWFALRGVVMVLLGLFALFWPAPALFAFALVFAAFSFADGVLAVVAGFRGASHSRERWGSLVVSGILGIIVGLVFFFFPLLGTMAYAFAAVLLIAIWALATGFAELAAASRMRRAIEGEWLLVVTGVLSVALGAILLVMLFTAPAPTMLSVAWVIGLYALAAGIALLVLAFRLKRRQEAAR